MCFDGDPCEVWDETSVRARKDHKCYECGLPIPIGDVHARIGTLFDGHWDSFRIHAGCLALAKFIDREMCDSSGFFVGGLAEEIGNQDGGDAHHELFCGIDNSEEEEGPCLRGCLGMSTRETLEWIWALATMPYRDISLSTH